MLKSSNSFDFEAHRGGRGLMPENTIAAMKNAIDIGVTTLEMDVVISQDKKVVVSHDPFFSEAITTTPDGRHLTKANTENYLLYSMPYEDIKKFDVGLKPHPGFPQQQKIPAYKPLLSTLIDSVEAYAALKGQKMQYNIEIKSKEGFDNVRHPAPEDFCKLVMDVIEKHGILSRTIVQSFDVRPLQYLHKNHPEVVLSYLVEQPLIQLQGQLDKLGFIPQIYSPNQALVSAKLVADCHSKGIKVIPWTVNTLDQMNTLLKLGVDGLISDYPNLFAQLNLEAKQ